MERRLRSLSGAGCSVRQTKGAPVNVTLTDSATLEVDTLKVGAAGVHAFVGVGGPYWQDTTGDGIIDGSDSPAAAGAMGLAMENVTFGMALMQPVAGGSTRYYALKGSGAVSLIGIGGLDLSVDNLTIVDEGAKTIHYIFFCEELLGQFDSVLDTKTKTKLFSNDYFHNNCLLFGSIFGSIQIDYRLSSGYWYGFLPD